MTRKVYVITDLGPGDGGKGGVVHAVAKSQRAHTIIKRGGAQGNHGVRTAAGETFAFSQWGCGTFDGTPTHLSQQMIVSPEGLLNEADMLRRDHGIHNPFSMLTIDQRSLVTTPLHGIASHLFELSRGNHPRGTIGTGVGQAYRDMDRYPDLTLTMADLDRPDLKAKLVAIRQNIHDYVMPVLEDANILREDSIAVRYELELLADDRFIDFIEARFREVARVATIVDEHYLGEVILPQPGVAVIETSHGVLTDRVYGFHPHTSAIRTLPSITRRVLDDAGYEGQVVNLGVSRAYAIRHGAGPLPTNNPALAEHLLPGSHKDDNRWQGSVRVGALDGVLLRYAINVCGGPTAFDGLAITWFDQVRDNGDWLMCDTYQHCDDEAVFTANRELRVQSHPTTEIQSRYVVALEDAQPNVFRQPICPDASRDVLYTTCAVGVENLTNIPVRMVSMGPTELDKLMK